MHRVADGFSRRAFLRAAAAVAVLPAVRLRAERTETLYNGIRLTEPWPPRRADFPSAAVRPPYLADPPAVVPIDVGRQLFVDDFLIEETSLARTFHAAKYVDDNPILRPSSPWETSDQYAALTKTPPNPAAMPFSDGVFYDPRERIFKMWYMGGYQQNTCYATSADGIAWHKPKLDVVGGTNIVNSGHRDSSTVWLDLVERDPSRRYKMSHWHDHYLELFASADGIHWREMGRTAKTGDRTTFFYNPFRNVWVYSLRAEMYGGSFRARRYWETPDLYAHTQWQPEEPVLWTSADVGDRARREYNVPAELYNLDCVAYESVLLGLFTIFRGEGRDREKPNDVCVGFSRDGFHWDRSNREPFLSVSESVGAWNWANVQSAGGCCLIVGDRLYFYVSGRQGVPGSNMPGICSTGLATLRRDGFASMERKPPGRVRRIGGVAEGTLTTRPVQFNGSELFVNADVGGGELRVEVLNREGRVIPKFGIESCVPVRGDQTRIAVRWPGVSLAALRGEAVRFRFSLTEGRIYAFWVSPSTSGASRGYVAAGGPGFTGLTDDR